jgi:hypothetical protein
MIATGLHGLRSGSPHSVEFAAAQFMLSVTTWAG